jgi:hypothetical protein
VEHSPKRRVRWDGEQRELLRICGVGRDGVAPPGRERVRADRAVLRVLQHEEDEHARDGDARVERGGQDV